MDDQQKKQDSGVRDQEIRAALDQHWAASDANDFETEHRIYHEDAVLDYPQSGERTRGRSNIQNQRASQPSKKRFAVRRIIGGGDLWVSEFPLLEIMCPSVRPIGRAMREPRMDPQSTVFPEQPCRP